MNVEEAHSTGLGPNIISRILMATTVLLSAFLLFQIQPLIAKYILPWFGGAATVWTICMLFFQFALLLGYSYSHFMVSHLRPRWQVIIHSLLLFLTLFLLPISPDKTFIMGMSNTPIIGILGLLTLTIGVPYFALSTTTSLIQAWYARINVGRSPYPLYALSNIGSFIALLTYPIFIETNFEIGDQASFWSMGYGVFIISLILICLIVGKSLWNFKAPKHEVIVDQSPADDNIFTWFMLATAASICLLATSDHLSRDVASVPFLWVIPLSIYLLSFVLCFESDRWYKRGLFAPLLFIFISVIVAENVKLISFTYLQQIILYCGFLFVTCMVCHGELAKQKPPVNRLTKFYLILAIGGAAGGVYVGLIAPKFFVLPLELFMGIIITIVVFSMVLFKDKNSQFYQGRTPWFWRSYAIFAALFVAFIYFYSVVKYSQVIEFKRNFYGPLRVMTKDITDGPRVKLMALGTTEHGIEILDNAQASKIPTAYYGVESGLGQALLSLKKPANVGMIGLGIGTIGAYGSAGDHYKIYEINPQVTEMAYKHFNYLNDTAAHIEIIHGDGRLSLEAEQDNQFDLLAIDAFSGDSIPVHLLTYQALELYMKQLKKEGILAIHTSNRYLELRPVVLGTAKAHDYKVIEIKNAADAKIAVNKSQWFLITQDGATFEKLQNFKHIVKRPKDLKEIIWTDNFSNIFSILKNN